MRFHSIFFVLSLFLMSSLLPGVEQSGALDHSAAATDEKFAAWVRSNAPLGWGVEEEPDRLILIRELSNGESLDIVLRFGPVLSREEQRRLATEYNIATERLAILRERLNRIPNTGGVYQPSNAEEDALADDYRKTLSQTRELEPPRYRTAEASVWVTFGPAPRWAADRERQEVLAEREALFAGLEELMRPY